MKKKNSRVGHSPDTAKKLPRVYYIGPGSENHKTNEWKRMRETFTCKWNSVAIPIMIVMSRRKKRMKRRETIHLRRFGPMWHTSQPIIGSP